MIRLANLDRRFKVAALVGATIGGVLPIAGVLHEQSLRPQVVLQGDGTTPPNSCVVTASLETTKHANSYIILVRYRNTNQGHAYCLWFLEGKIFAADWRGTVEIRPKRGGVAGIAAALPVPAYGLVVESAAIL